ncbi:unnamed protein product [Rotaria sordida]|uniref:Uncharacterized protein n=1 Tax=Rotaria sordida TaxID=392033 RepID=A0A819M6X9_9BILA|nr:unnamed protein product [Rotaria sordida]CAF3974712.1 unnamed protein product [Rotaria sordida]
MISTPPSTAIHLIDLTSSPSTAVPLIDLTLSPKPVMHSTSDSLIDPRLRFYSTSLYCSQVNHPMNLPLPKWYSTLKRSSMKKKRPITGNQTNGRKFIKPSNGIKLLMKGGKVLSDPIFKSLWHMDNDTKKFAETAGGKTTFYRCSK